MKRVPIDLSLVLFVFVMFGAVGCGGGGTPNPSVNFFNDTSNQATDVSVATDTNTGTADTGQSRDLTTADEVFHPTCSQAGCECALDSDCDSNFCILTRQGRVCAQTCDNGQACKQGLKCTDVNRNGQTSKICIDPFALLCRPCEQDSDCRTPMIKADNHCVLFGAEGSFCGTACTADKDCPEGYACTAQNGQPRQCLPANNQCECTKWFKKAGYKTNCYVKNQYGKCTGERTCDTQCNADTPAAEKCDGKDDNCNGETDEPGAQGCQLFYKDSDKDGYSDPNVKPSECRCGPIEKGGVAYSLSAADRKGDDCDDSKAEINPGARDMPETEAPFKDTNCDGIDGDAADSIFVSTTGQDDGECGSMNKPCKTIAKGLEQAEKQGKSAVLVAKGRYEESLSLKNGISIFGGYDDTQKWKRSKDFVVTIHDTNTTGILAANIDKPTVLNMLKIQGKNAGPGESSYAFVAKTCTKALRLVGLEIRAGNGGNGMDGAAQQPVNMNGQDGTDGKDGGKGGQSQCSVPGGNGGKADGCKTQDGGTGLNGAAGGQAGKKGCGCGQSGGDGHDGQDGQNGKDGLDASSPNQPWGSIDDSRLWVGTAGDNGGNGRNGQGGGGGGSGGSTKCGPASCTGGTGGGGGAGGCGGPGGPGGGAGGGSFGVLAIDAPITIKHCIVVMGQGGDGGKGQPGSDGGKGGKGGKGSSPTLCGDGGDGGNGGDGGKGGAGAGGCGGISVGIGWKGAQPTIEGSHYSGGKPGKGGDGAGSNDGCDGKKAITHAWK